ncbi:glutathione S-transferase [Ramlibacter sp. MAHUQ-53]|uniref:glutathione S-transferase n=1 Tax=unclassified Ramlibacter TaxID=2617605 RepID=UPI0036263B4C
MARTVLTISSKNYGAWALRGWLMARLAGLAFTEKVIPPDDPAMKAEMLLLSSSMRVPSLDHEGVHVWDTLAIGEYLHEVRPRAGLLPADRKARAHCRAICGEMHSGFAALRGALPMNIRAHFPGFKVWSRAQADIDRILEIWRECLASYGGPFLFGKQPSMADAMYAPVVTRFLTYDVALDKPCAAYCRRIMELPAMQEWVAAAKEEPAEIDELDAEF